MIETMVEGAICSGDLGQLDYVRACVEQAIEDVVRGKPGDTWIKQPQWVLDRYRASQLEALNTAIEAARIQMAAQ